MTDESPDKFTATDPLTQNTIKVDNHGHGFNAYIYEYGASSPVVINQETVRAIMSEGARREREKAFDEEGIGIANPIDHLCEGCNRTMKFITKVRMCLECSPSGPIKFDKWPGDETDKELMDQLKELD